MPTARLIQTSPDGLRLADVAAPAFQPDLPNWYQGQAIVLEPTVRYQRWLGFGGSFTESAAWTLSHPVSYTHLRAHET